MYRILFVASFAMLLANPTSSQVGRQTPADSAKRLTLTQLWTSDATYTDRLNGVVFRYPSVWRNEGMGGFNPPLLVVSAEKPIAAFGYSAGGFGPDRDIGPYSTTNLEGFGIVYSAAPAANRAECDARAASISENPEDRTVVFGGRAFSESDTSNGGMSQPTSGKLYATYVRPNCYLFEIDVAVALSVDDVAYLTPAQLDFINTHLSDIMKSVWIAPTQRQ